MIVTSDLLLASPLTLLAGEIANHDDYDAAKTGNLAGSQITIT